MSCSFLKPTQRIYSVAPSASNSLLTALSYLMPSDADRRSPRCAVGHESLSIFSRLLTFTVTKLLNECAGMTANIYSIFSALLFQHHCSISNSQTSETYRLKRKSRADRRCQRGSARPTCERLLVYGGPAVKPPLHVVLTPANRAGAETPQLQRHGEVPAPYTPPECRLR